DHFAPFRDRDYQRIDLLRDALGGPVAGPGLDRVDGRVGHHLDVGPGDLAAVGVDQDGSVHLRHLVEHGRAVVDIEPDPAGKHEGEVLGFADDDQSAGTSVENVVDTLAEL